MCACKRKKGISKNEVYHKWGFTIEFLPYGSALKLQEKEAENCSYPLRLDVYGSGCDHKCSYCYARAQMIVGGWNNSRNPNHPFPRVADIECIRKTLIDLPKKKPKCVSGSWRKEEKEATVFVREVMKKATKD